MNVYQNKYHYVHSHYWSIIIYICKRYTFTDALVTMLVDAFGYKVEIEKIATSCQFLTKWQSQSCMIVKYSVNYCVHVFEVKLNFLVLIWEFYIIYRWTANGAKLPHLLDYDWIPPSQNPR